jgi:circadian clock protein KaiC
MLKVNKISTGNSQIDKLIDGGYESGSINLIEGGPGTGKTILAVNFLLNGAKKNEPGVYVTFEENIDQLKNHLSSFGVDLNKESKITIVSQTPEQLKSLIENGSGPLDSLINKTKAKRLVIDTITPFVLMEKDKLSMMEACSNLFGMIREWNCTTLLTADQDSISDNQNEHISNILEYEVDSIILLHNREVNNMRKKLLEVLKIRGSPHPDKLYEFEINSKGIVLK